MIFPTFDLVWLCNQHLLLIMIISIYDLFFKQAYKSIVNLINIQMDLDLKNFTFSNQLEDAIKMSKWNQNFFNSPKLTPPIYRDSQDNCIEGNLFKVKHQHYCLLQFESNMYVFLTNQTITQKGKGQFELIVYMFVKDNGNNFTFQVKQLKGKPSCITAGMSTFAKTTSCPQDNKFTIKQEEFQYRIVVLIGIEEGFIKVIQFVAEKQNSARPIQASFKIQQKSITSITIAQKHQFNRKNICFILLEDLKVFIFNYASKQVVAIYQPPILGHDFAISLSLHCSGRYFLTSSKSGQMTFWQINGRAYQAIMKSEDKDYIKTSKSSMEQQDQVKQLVYTFKSKDRVISLFPIYMLHSASIHGIKWITFMGNLVAFISSNGLFRIIAINFQSKDEFIVLLQYQIEEGEAITSVQLYPSEQKVYVTKAKEYIKTNTSIKETNINHKNIAWREESIKKKDHKFMFNSSSLEKVQGKNSYIQILSFSSELRVQYMKRVYIKKQNKKTVPVQSFNHCVFSKDRKFFVASDGNVFYIGMQEVQDQI